MVAQNAEDVDSKHLYEVIYVRLVMANLFLRLSSSFACVQVKLTVRRKREIVFSHIVGEVHLEGARICFSLKHKQKNKK